MQGVKDFVSESSGPQAKRTKPNTVNQPSQNGLGAITYPDLFYIYTKPWSIEEALYAWIPVKEIMNQHFLVK